MFFETSSLAKLDREQRQKLAALNLIHQQDE
jgi:hypothetical protein